MEIFVHNDDVHGMQDLVIRKNWAYAFVTDDVMVSIYASVVLDITDEWLDPVWDFLRGKHYVLESDETLDDDDMMHRSARELVFLLTENCDVDCLHME